MRTRSFVFIVAIFFYPQAGSISAQQTTVTAASQAQAATLLAQSVAALVGKSSVADVTLTGTAERIAGGDDENGAANYRAVAGSSRLDLSFSSGTTSEIRSTSAKGVTGSWIDSSGVSHAMAGHNVMTDVGWFPLFTLKGILSSPNSVANYIGVETRGNGSLLHLAAWQSTPGGSEPTAILPQHLSQTDLYLDPTTFLPVILAFNVHPDSDALTDIPIEIHFSDYRSVGGILVPFHMQRFLNNGLYLDIQFQNAVINSGLTVNSITN